MKIFKKMIAMTLVAVLSVTGLSGCSSSKLYTSDTSGYKEITAIPGISFVVPNSVAQATVINQISGSMEFDSSTTYSYKDGTESYIVFNMNNIVILAQKGTSFGFDLVAEGEDKTSCLDNSSILGTWLKAQNGESLSYEEGLTDGVYKIIAGAQAGVTITTELFGDFMGDLAVVTDGTTEYALFMGAPTELYNELGGNSKNMIETVAMSLKMTTAEATSSDLMSSSDASTEAGTDSSIDSQTDADSEDTESSEAASSVSVSSDSSSAAKTEAAVEMATESPAEASNEASTEASASASSEVSIEAAADVSAEASTQATADSATEESTTSDETEASNAASLENSTEEVTDISENTEEKEEETSSEGMNFNNQREYAKASESDPSYTDIYSTADIGDTVYYQAMDGNGDMQMLTVTLNKIYGQDESEALIRGYCTNGTTGYAYPTAPDGCHWEAAEFTVAATNGSVLPDIYTDVKFTGLDGENLNFKGIPYSMRTYNLMNGSSVIVYYAVPNGCDDYLLRVGDTVQEDDINIINAFYEVS